MEHRQRGSRFQRKLADGSLSPRWSIKYRDHQGKQVVEVVGTSKKEATAVLEQRLAAIRNDTYQAPSEKKRISFKDYAVAWLATRRPTLKPSSYRSVENILGMAPKKTRQRRAPSATDVFGAQMLDRIESSAIASYLASLTAAKLKPKSVNNARSLLSSLFEDARAEKYITANPVRNRLVKSAKVLSPTDREERIVPTTAQVKALLDHLDGTDARSFAFCFTMAATGARPGEVAALQVKHLAPAVGQISVMQSFDPRPLKIGLPKNGLTREVDAGVSVFSALQRVGDHTNPEAFILAEADGSAYRFDLLRKKWSRIQSAAGCGSWPAYSLRHYAASRMLQEGESIAYVARQLGHSKQSMTLAHYSKYIPDKKRERGADRLAAELLAPRYPEATNPVATTPKQA